MQFAYKLNDNNGHLPHSKNNSTSSNGSTICISQLKFHSLAITSEIQSNNLCQQFIEFITNITFRIEHFTVIGHINISILHLDSGIWIN